MTEDEAKTIAAILCTADRGCDVCVHDLAEKFSKAFPEHERIMNETLVQKGFDEGE